MNIPHISIGSIRVRDPSGIGYIYLDVFNRYAAAKCLRELAYSLNLAGYHLAGIIYLDKHILPNYKLRRVSVKESRAKAHLGIVIELCYLGVLAYAVAGFDCDIPDITGL